MTTHQTEPRLHRIWVDGDAYEIEYQTNDTDHMLDDLLGYVDHKRRKIVLDDRYPAGHKEVLCHELLHVLAQHTVVKLEEDDVMRLGYALRAVMKANPEFLDWMSKP